MSPSCGLPASEGGSPPTSTSTVSPPAVARLGLVRLSGKAAPLAHINICTRKDGKAKHNRRGIKKMGKMVFSGLVLRLCGREVILQEGLQVLKGVPLISLSLPALHHQFMERGGAARGTGHPVAPLHLLQHLARAPEVGGVSLTHPNVTEAALSQLPLHGQSFPEHLPGVPPKAHALFLPFSFPSESALTSRKPSRMQRTIHKQTEGIPDTTGVVIPGTLVSRGARQLRPVARGAHGEKPRAPSLSK
ncbi:hypothetical protein EYF80_004017 [Liparis tanakae]|uniref:Uncharacterized protein n=1 Tax=Liparis tanakae TaxID=230148 RepID=A0A4Z2J6K1_9TELE|nr:hypothetical protein EYF80_004017 [Liparis tanakae]